MIRLIVEIDGGILCGIYSDAPLTQDFDIEILDRDCGDVDTETSDENTRLDTLLRDPGWRGIY